MLNTVQKIAQEAGSIVMSYYGKTPARYKRDDYGAGSIVTNADLESEKMIVKALKSQFPDYGIYAEEECRHNVDAPFVWYVDPLDGTANFARNIPLFGISIGLLHHGTPLFGVLYFPALNLMVHAEVGKGAYANNKKISVSKRDLQTALYHADGDSPHSAMNVAISRECGLIKTIGASSFELAQLAMGDAELYVRPNSPHDVVAGIVIVEEAGGKVTDERGDSWTVKSNIAIASNGVIHNDVLSIL